MYKSNYTFVLETEEGNVKYLKGDLITKENVVKYGLEQFVSKVNVSEMDIDLCEKAPIV